MLAILEGQAAARSSRPPSLLEARSPSPYTGPRSPVRSMLDVGEDSPHPAARLISLIEPQLIYVSLSNSPRSKHARCRQPTTVTATPRSTDTEHARCRQSPFARRQTGPEQPRLSYGPKLPRTYAEPDRPPSQPLRRCFETRRLWAPGVRIVVSPRPDFRLPVLRHHYTPRRPGPSKACFAGRQARQWFHGRGHAGQRRRQPAAVRR